MSLENAVDQSFYIQFYINGASFDLKDVQERGYFLIPRQDNSPFISIKVQEESQVTDSPAGKYETF